jgi:hypothetical protein
MRTILEITFILWAYWFVSVNDSQTWCTVTIDKHPEARECTVHGLHKVTLEIPK